MGHVRLAQRKRKWNAQKYITTCSDGGSANSAKNWVVCTNKGRGAVLGGAVVGSLPHRFFERITTKERPRNAPERRLQHRRLRPGSSSDVVDGGRGPPGVKGARRGEPMAHDVACGLRHIVEVRALPRSRRVGVVQNVPCPPVEVVVRGS